MVSKCSTVQYSQYNTVQYLFAFAKTNTKPILFVNIVEAGMYSVQ